MPVWMHNLSSNHIINVMIDYILSLKFALTYIKDTVLLQPFFIRLIPVTWHKIYAWSWVTFLKGLQLLLPCSCKYLKPPKQRLWHIVLKSVKAIGAVGNKTSDNVGTFKIAGKLQHIQCSKRREQNFQFWKLSAVVLDTNIKSVN